MMRNKLKPLYLTVCTALLLSLLTGCASLNQSLTVNEKLNTSPVLYTDLTQTDSQRTYLLPQ